MKNTVKRLSLCIRYWDFCNNNCSFCFEKNTAFNGMFYRPSVYAIEENNNRVKELVDLSKYKYFTFKILGGELFSYYDAEISKALNCSIQYFYNILNESGTLYKIKQSKNVPETLVIASNLLYKDTRMLYSCLDVLAEKEYKTNASMMVSYDLYGRFNKPGLAQLYYKNYVDIFNRYRSCIKPVVSFIMSKQNIECLVNQRKCEELDIFNALYDMDVPFDMTLLLNDMHVQQFKYSRQQLEEFIQTIKEKYPRFISIFKSDKTKKSIHIDTTRLTIQGGKVMDEHTLFNKHKKHDCIFCPVYTMCRHSLSDISYNAYECDVKEIIEACENY